MGVRLRARGAAILRSLPIFSLVLVSFPAASSSAASPARPLGPGAAAGATATASSSAEAVRVQACDGSRAQPIQDPRALDCTRWVVTWREAGTPAGLVVASSYDEVVAERERQLGFARRYARYFEQPLDERYADPSPPICDACTSTTPAGRWGEGQKFSDGAARKAITASTDQLAALGTALDDHLPRLEDAARLARDPATSKVARAYGKQLHDSVLYLGKGRLQLDDAAVFRSEKLAREVGSAATEHVESLASAYDKLLAAVGKEVGRAHGGNYAESDAQGPKAPYLQVSIDGAKVTATYFAGGGQSIWFDGEVALDGGITGRSLVAPESGTLTCQQHAESCGYVYIPSVLRFTERQDPDEKSVQTAELWFQRSTWVMAKPFTR